MTDILISDATVVTMDGDRRVIDRGALRLPGGSLRRSLWVIFDVHWYYSGT